MCRRMRRTNNASRPAISGTSRRAVSALRSQMWQSFVSAHACRCVEREHARFDRVLHIVRRVGDHIREVADLRFERGLGGTHILARR